MNIDQKILACVDGTPVSDAVTDYAAWAARTLGAPLELLHVLDRHLALSATQDHSGTIGLDAQEKLLDKLTREDETRTRTAREAGRLFLHGLRARALASGARTVDTRLRHGDVEETLSEQQAGSRLLVLGKTGPQSGTAEHALGRHLEWVVRSVSRPVLVAAETYREPTQVLFAFDGSGITRKGVEMLAGSTLLTGVSLVLLMAGAPSGAETRQLELAVQTLKKAGIDASPSTVKGAPQEAIANALSTGGFDLLVMGAYGHSPLRSLFMGSKTTGVLKTSRVPTLLLR
jgi:nucleotide-binding universal stress UspA family protein